MSPYAGEQHVYHLYVVRSMARDNLKAHLAAKGIAADIHYPYLDYQQPVFRHDKDMISICLPHSEQATKEILTIPCYPELSQQDAAFVVDTINQWKQ